MIKHNESKGHRLRVIDSKTPANSVIAQMDAIDLNSRRDDDDDDDDRDSNVNASGWGSPGDVRVCDAQRDPTLAENVGVWCFNSVFHVPQLETFKFSTHLHY